MEKHDIIKKFFSEGFTRTEIALKANLSASQVDRILKKYGLKILNKSSIKKNTDRVQVIKSLVCERKTDKEISLLTGTCKSTVARIRKEVLNFSSWRDTILLTDRQKSILVGSILGDSHITPSKPNSQVVFAHCIAQKDYFLWKYTELQNLFNKYSINNRIRKGVQHTEIRCNSICLSVLNTYRKLFYVNGIKCITNDNIKLLDELGLSVLFMDDGGKVDTTYQLCTQSFSREECFILQKYLYDKWKILTTLNKKNVIRIKMSSRDLFTSIIKSDIVPCMKYKIFQ